MKLIIFFHAAARKTIINCLVTTQHRPTPYEVELAHCSIIYSKCEKIESHIQKRTSIELMLLILFREQPKISIYSIVSHDVWIHEIIIQIPNFITCMLVCYPKENSINFILFSFGYCCLFSCRILNCFWAVFILYNARWIGWMDYVLILFLHYW